LISTPIPLSAPSASLALAQPLEDRLAHAPAS
jgi:hypothetical protein